MLHGSVASSTRGAIQLTVIVYYICTRSRKGWLFPLSFVAQWEPRLGFVNLSQETFDYVEETR